VTSEELRQAFLDFFVARGHEIVRSASLIPHGDPTLLFTSAGMVPFKPYFLGRERPPATRLTSIQRCFRTTDIESVGDATHQTFFEMLGNFSIGDYFKREAIPWAWRFVTETLGIPRDRLWNTVFLDDDDAFNLWVEQGQRPDRIKRYGVEEGNYWFSGDVGPCGPCSEIYYDFGAGTGCLQPECEPSHSCGRFLEIWNIVFTAFNLHEDGSQSPLPAPNIDTGAGLERIASVLQHKGPGIASDYETDLLKPLVEAAVRLSSREYGSDAESDRAFRVVADHARAITFLLADGVLPGNEGRGYVLRRILRRSVYFGRRTGMSQGAIVQMVEAVLDKMSGVYPYLIERRPSIVSLAAQEENRFHETLERGLQRLEEVLEQLPGESKTFPGDEAFRLYDTYGLPKELTDEIAQLRGLVPDDSGFEAAMERQREQARSRGTFSAASLVEASQFAALGVSTGFVGYERLSETSEIVALGRSSEAVGRLEAGDRGWLVLGSTPFYAEGGGQVGDAGTIKSSAGTLIVEDTQRREGGVIVHYGYVSEGALEVGDSAEALVDPVRRNDVMRNHTGTHMLHAALREVLGPHAHQAGSLVAPDRLRFDFTHAGQMSAEELLAVERLANDVVRRDDSVSTAVSDYDDAIKSGALAFFGEKYGDEVRVVTIANIDGQQYSSELCGGTHVSQTGKLGFVHVVSEGGIGSGIRRIEALTGRAAERWAQDQTSLLERVSAQIGATPATLESRVAGLLSDLETERKHLADLQRAKGREQAEELLAAAEKVGPTNIVVGQTEAASTKDLRELGDLLRNRLGSAAIVLGSVVEQRPQLVVQLTPDLVDRGLKAGEIIARVSEATGGRGGGRPDSAQSGGSDPARLPEALQLARKLLIEQLTDA
jgi:alanyl-tRNA synthetase